MATTEFDYDAVLSPYAEEEKKLQRRQALIQALLGNSGGQVPLRHYGPLNALGDVAKTAALVKTNKDVEKQRTALGEKERATQQSAFEALQAGWNDEAAVLKVASGLGPAADLAKERLKALGKLGKGGDGADPYFKDVPTSAGILKWNARTGTYELATDAKGNAYMPPGIDPAAQGAVSRSKAEGEAIGKQVGSEAEQVMGEGERERLYSMAENYLKDATGSGLGTLADKAGALVGYEVPGSAEADQMKILAGALTSKVPRMQGQQSNYDVQLYKEMAGDLGNSFLPRERRKKALQTLRLLSAPASEARERALNALYPARAKAAAAAPAAGGLSPEEKKELEELRKRLAKPK